MNHLVHSLAFPWIRNSVMQTRTRSHTHTHTKERAHSQALFFFLESWQGG